MKKNLEERKNLITFADEINIIEMIRIANNWWWRNSRFKKS